MLPDVVVGGLRFCRDSSSVFFFFFARYPRNSTKTGHLLGSECDLKMLVRNLGYNLTLQTGDSKLLFSRRLRNLTATLTKRDIHNRIGVLETTRFSYIVSKCHELWSTGGLKLDRHFYAPSVNSAFCFIARLC